MKKEENCLRLEEIRSALAKADAERLSSGVSAQERLYEVNSQSRTDLLII